jgi:hypothetical protein
MGSSRLTASSRPLISSLLTKLIQLLRELEPPLLSLSLISYVFLPLSTILQRNASSEIPNQILEKILTAFRILCEAWWWECDVKIWEQIFMLCGAVIGGVESKSIGEPRDDETKEAAGQCLLALLRPRTEDEAVSRSLPKWEAHSRLVEYQEHTKASHFVPILGQTLESLLREAESQNLSLQRVSLDLLFLFVDIYAPDYLIPSILPGVASSMTKVSLGRSSSKGWAKGELVAAALKVMQVVIVKAVGDDICAKEGALIRFEDLEDLATFNREEDSSTPVDIPKTFATIRTATWLRGTSSQLHMALNTLTPLVTHPTPTALHALSRFSSAVLSSTSLTMPQSQPLLLSFLLSLSNSDFASISSEALQRLRELLSSAKALQQTLLHNMWENLSSLPRLLSIQADGKVKHVAGLISAVCRLATLEDSHSRPSLPAIASGIGKLLGPSGGIEKWGWSLLSVLEFDDSPVAFTGGRLTFESDSDTPEWISFPAMEFKNISAHGTRYAVESMFHSLGNAGGDSCLFSVEWFTSIGRTGTSRSCVAALWCACRLLEGVANVTLSSTGLLDIRQSKRLAKESRALARAICELWDNPDLDDLLDGDFVKENEDTPQFHVRHQNGLVPLHETLKIIPSSTSTKPTKMYQPTLHRSLCLQFISVVAGVLQARFHSLFIHALYPVLRSLVSPASFLSSTALATLHFITLATSFASPANLLISNFDYALDAVSRRLTRQWLDLEATKVFAILVRLVGSDVVDRADDVVEECFDRLDEFHGYEAIVDGFIAVLTEVINVIGMDLNSTPSSGSGPSEPSPPPASLEGLGFFSWLPTRKDQLSEEANQTDFGPAPREAWGDSGSTNNEEPTPGASQECENSTPIQALTKQIISRSIYFLTHDSPVIRARILNLLGLAVPVLPESALLPSIHSAWPFIVNRLSDTETFVLSSAACLVEALATHVGGYMYRKIWDDVWPRFKSILAQLDDAIATTAVARQVNKSINAESAYTHSHRLHRSVINTMAAVVKGVHSREACLWEVILAFRRFLGVHAHEELQRSARGFYMIAGAVNPDMVWLALSSASEGSYPTMGFMARSCDINKNAGIIINSLS